MPVEVLGLTVSLDTSGMSCVPAPQKVLKWSSWIQDALASKRLPPGLSSKLAGALSWASQHAFHKLGRDMLRPLFAQQKRLRDAISTPLRLALEWWLEVLQLELSQHRPWRSSDAPIAHLFADASGSPPCLGAVLLIDGEVHYTKWVPPPSLMAIFVARRDNQIMGLELRALALGICSFASLLTSRRVVLWSDNTGSEYGTRKGAVASWDHNQIIHSIWLKLAQLKVGAHVERVPTDANIADLPSRCKFELLMKLGGSWQRPILDDIFWKSDSWDALSLKKLFA